jgi:hypothetical protein
LPVVGVVVLVLFAALAAPAFEVALVAVEPK